MKEKLLQFIYSNGGIKEFISINDEMKRLFGDNFEKAKSLIRDIQQSGEADISGDLWRLGSTSGVSEKNWKREQVDRVISYDFDNVPLKARIRFYEPKTEKII